MSQYPPPPTPSPYGAPASAAASRPGALLNRFLARLIDHVLLAVVQGVAWGILSAIILTGFSHSTAEWFVFYLVLSVVSVAISLGYFTVMESSRGQTVGKMALKLRTFGPDGVSSPTVEQALRRNSYVGLNLISIIPVLGPLVAGLAELAAVITIAVTLNNDVPDHQGFHDRFAGGTMVRQIG